jgi:superfamily II DNA or RNA helicase
MDICNCLLGKKIGGTINSINNILEIIDKDKEEWKSAFNKYHTLSKPQILDYLNNDELEGGVKKKRDVLKGKPISEYTVINIIKFLETDKGLYYQGKKKDQFGNMVNKKLFEYDPYETAFERNYDKYRDYQKRIIENWSVSAQELLILYYGVGTGKTIIATTCAEEFTRLNTQSSVYFILPASLVFNTIGLMFHYGIDPTIKRNGEYIYNFISYQQMIRTKYDFKDNSLMIIDEVHNLRNLISREKKERRGLKWINTGDIGLYGNVLSKQLLENSDKVIRKLFMTGTLFVNSPFDLEPIISLGYNKVPMIEYKLRELEGIMYDDVMDVKTKKMDREAFKNYYQGLISFYRIGGENLKLMPTVEYHFTPIITYDDPSLLPDPEEDPFLINTRTFGSNEKANWVVNFLKSHKNEKTLLYIQFLDKQISILTDLLTKNKIAYNLISGELTAKKKQEVIDKYNNGKINLIIFSLAIKEGISFKETNNFIVFTPYWNYAITEQVIARAIRLDSHKMGDKSKVNVYFPIMNSLYKTQTPEEANKIVQPFINKANDIMNNIGIKNFHTVDDMKEFFDIENINEKRQRDIDMYLRMFNKMNDINFFEKRLLALPSFDDVNNIENNEFIKVFNQEILDIEASGKTLTKKQKMELKQKLYKEFYKKSIAETNKKVERLSKNNDIFGRDEEDFNDFNNNVADKRNEIRKALKENKSLDYILSLFNLDKSQIQKLNAFFTPSIYAKKLIELSGIEDDNRDNIKILEPTAGIGNLIGQLLNLPNCANYMIDCVEISNIFYQIGSVIYENIDNIKWMNMDFLNYSSRYNYDYIYMNPPFNIKTDTGNKYDIQFVAKAYNMLNNDGVLTAIISSKFSYDTSPMFKKFREILDKLKENSNAELMKLDTGFQAEERVAKDMKTNVSMYYIKLNKVKDFIIDIEIEKPKKTKSKIKYEYKPEPEEDIPQEPDIPAEPAPEPAPEPEPIPEPIPEPPAPVEPEKANCNDVITIPQYKGTCWFNAVLMSLLYSQYSRELLLKNNIYKTNKDNIKIYKIINDILEDHYVSPTRNIEYFKKLKPEVIIEEYLDPILSKVEIKRILKSGWSGDIFLPNFISLLGKSLITIDYDNSYKKNKYYLNLTKAINVNFNKKIIHNLKDNYKEILTNEKDTKPDYIIVNLDENTNIFNYYINDILKDKLSQKEIDDIEIKFKVEDKITYNGETYILDSCMLSNYNRNKGGHAITGITCNNNKYVYNGWMRTTDDPAIANTELFKENNLPCELMKYNWDINNTDKFCLNSKQCNLPSAFGSSSIKVCFSFSKGARTLIYVKQLPMIKAEPIPIPKPITPKPVKPIKPKPEPKKKDCPAGKVLNPKTGRCVNEKGATAKKIATPKPAPAPPAEPKPSTPKPKPEPKKKDCPAGKVLNPKTGRCVNEKGATAKKIATPTPAPAPAPAEPLIPVDDTKSKLLLSNKLKFLFKNDKSSYVDRINYYIYIKSFFLKLKDKNEICINKNKTYMGNIKSPYHIVIEKQIGSPSKYGTIYLSHFFKSYGKFAVKIVKKSKDNIKEFNILKQLSNLTSLNKSPHFPITYGLTNCPKLDTDKERNKDRMATFNELADGDLRTIIKNPDFHSNDNIVKNTIQQIFFSILSFHNYTKKIHKDSHWGNFLFHKIKAGGYFHYNIFGVDIYIENLGFLWVIWDFSSATNIKPNTISNDYYKLINAFIYEPKGLIKPSDFMYSNDISTIVDEIYDIIKFEYDKDKVLWLNHLLKSKLFENQFKKPEDNKILNLGNPYIIK